MTHITNNIRHMKVNFTITVICRYLDNVLDVGFTAHCIYFICFFSSLIYCGILHVFHYLLEKTTTIVSSGKRVVGSNKKINKESQTIEETIQSAVRPMSRT